MSLIEISQAIGSCLAPYEPIFKLIAYVIGPIVAIVAFFFNRKDRRELIEKAIELGAAKQENLLKDLELRESESALESSRQEMASKAAEVDKLRSDLRVITESDSDLWMLRPPERVAEFQNWLRAPQGAKFITIGNLKGGVGKTTLAANFGAYVSHKLNKPVLIVDLDFQGSLSNMLLLANETEQVESHVELLFDEDAGLATVDRASIQLFRKLSRAWLVPSNYSFAKMENRLLLQWVLQEDGGVDVRYRLSNALLRPEVRERYAAVIFDMPPRMSLGAVNALVASHYFVVPTIADTLSSEAVGQFIRNVKAIKSDLGLDIDLAGVVGMMTRQKEVTLQEAKALDSAREAARAWNDQDCLYKTTIPRRVAIANAAGQDIAYLDPEISGLFDPLFEEMRTSIWRGGGP